MELAALVCEGVGCSRPAVECYSSAGDDELPELPDFVCAPGETKSQIVPYRAEHLGGEAGVVLKAL